MDLFGSRSAKRTKDIFGRGVSSTTGTGTGDPSAELSARLDSHDIELTNAKRRLSELEARPAVPFLTNPDLFRLKYLRVNRTGTGLVYHTLDEVGDDAAPEISLVDGVSYTVRAEAGAILNLEFTDTLPEGVEASIRRVVFQQDGTVDVEATPGYTASGSFLNVAADLSTFAAGVAATVTVSVEGNGDYTHWGVYSMQASLNILRSLKSGFEIVSATEVYETGYARFPITITFNQDLDDGDLVHVRVHSDSDETGNLVDSPEISGSSITFYVNTDAFVNDSQIDLDIRFDGTASISNGIEGDYVLAHEVLKANPGTVVLPRLEPVQDASRYIRHSGGESDLLFTGPNRLESEWFLSVIVRINGYNEPLTDIGGEVFALENSDPLEAVSKVDQLIEDFPGDPAIADCALMLLIKGDAFGVADYYVDFAFSLFPSAQPAPNLVSPHPKVAMVLGTDAFYFGPLAFDSAIYRHYITDAYIMHGTSTKYAMAPGEFAILGDLLYFQINDLHNLADVEDSLVAYVEMDGRYFGDTTDPHRVQMPVAVYDAIDPDTFEGKTATIDIGDTTIIIIDDGTGTGINVPSGHPPEIDLDPDGEDPIAIIPDPSTTDDPNEIDTGAGMPTDDVNPGEIVKRFDGKVPFTSAPDSDDDGGSMWGFIGKLAGIAAAVGLAAWLMRNFAGAIGGLNPLDRIPNFRYQPIPTNINFRISRFPFRSGNRSFAQLRRRFRLPRNVRNGYSEVPTQFSDGSVLDVLSNAEIELRGRQLGEVELVRGVRTSVIENNTFTEYMQRFNPNDISRNPGEFFSSRVNSGSGEVRMWQRMGGRFTDAEQAEIFSRISGGNDLASANEFLEALRQAATESEISQLLRAEQTRLMGGTPFVDTSIVSNASVTFSGARRTASDETRDVIVVADNSNPGSLLFQVDTTGLSDAITTAQFQATIYGSLTIATPEPRPPPDYVLEFPVVSLVSSAPPSFAPLSSVVYVYLGLERSPVTVEFTSAIGGHDWFLGAFIDGIGTVLDWTVSGTTATFYFHTYYTDPATAGQPHNMEITLDPDLLQDGSAEVITLTVITNPGLTVVSPVPDVRVSEGGQQTVRVQLPQGTVAGTGAAAVASVASPDYGIQTSTAYFTEDGTAFEFTVDALAVTVDPPINVTTDTFAEVPIELTIQCTPNSNFSQPFQLLQNAVLDLAPQDVVPSSETGYAVSSTVTTGFINTVEVILLRQISPSTSGMYVDVSSASGPNFINLPVNVRDDLLTLEFSLDLTTVSGVYSFYISLHNIPNSTGSALYNLNPLEVNIANPANATEYRLLSFGSIEENQQKQLLTLRLDSADADLIAIEVDNGELNPQSRITPYSTFSSTKRSIFTDITAAFDSRFTILDQIVLGNANTDEVPVETEYKTVNVKHSVNGAQFISSTLINVSRRNQSVSSATTLRYGTYNRIEIVFEDAPQTKPSGISIPEYNISSTSGTSLIDGRTFIFDVSLVDVRSGPDALDVTVFDVYNKTGSVRWNTWTLSLAALPSNIIGPTVPTKLTANAYINQPFSETFYVDESLSMSNVGAAINGVNSFSYTTSDDLSSISVNFLPSAVGTEYIGVYGYSYQYASKLYIGVINVTVSEKPAVEFAAGLYQNDYPNRGEYVRDGSAQTALYGGLHNRVVGFNLSSALQEMPSSVEVRYLAARPAADPMFELMTKLDSSLVRMYNPVGTEHGVKALFLDIDLSKLDLPYDGCLMIRVDDVITSPVYTYDYVTPIPTGTEPYDPVYENAATTNYAFRFRKTISRFETQSLQPVILNRIADYTEYDDAEKYVVPQNGNDAAENPYEIITVQFQNTTSTAISLYLSTMGTFKDSSPTLLHFTVIYGRNAYDTTARLRLTNESGVSTMFDETSSLQLFAGGSQPKRLYVGTVVMQTISEFPDDVDSTAVLVELSAADSGNIPQLAYYRADIVPHPANGARRRISFEWNGDAISTDVTRFRVRVSNPSLPGSTYSKYIFL